MKAFKRIFSIFMALILLLLPLASCDTPNAGDDTTVNDETTAPKEITTPEETTAPEEEDLSNVPVRDVSDYPNDSFYLSEEEKAYLESQGVDPDQFLCKVFGGWSWLDFEELMTTGEPYDQILGGYEFDLKKMLEWQDMSSTQYISYTLTDWKGSFSEPIIPQYQITSTVDEGERVFSAPNGSKTRLREEAIERFIIDPDRNLLPESITQEGLKAVFSVVPLTKDRKGLKIEKVYIMRPSGPVDYYGTTYEILIYYVTNYGDYILLGDPGPAGDDFLLMDKWFFNQSLSRWRNYLIENELGMESGFWIPNTYWRAIARHGIPSEYGYLSSKEKEDIHLSLYQGIYPKGKYS